MNIDLEALKQAAQAATPGEWRYFPKRKYDEHHVSVPIAGSGMHLALFPNGCPTDRPKEDAEFIAAANPAVVLELIARLERAEATTQTKLSAPAWPGQMEGKGPPADWVKLEIPPRCDKLGCNCAAWKAEGCAWDGAEDAERHPPAPLDPRVLAAFEAIGKWAGPSLTSTLLKILAQHPEDA